MSEELKQLPQSEDAEKALLGCIKVIQESKKLLWHG